MDPHVQATILLAAVAVVAPVVMGLSSRGPHSSHPVLLHYFLLGVSAVYIALMSYVLSFLTSFLSSLKNEQDWDYFVFVMFSVLLIQFLRAKADMAALAVSAATSPVAGDDDTDGLKIRPPMGSLVYSLWVAGLVIYSIYLYVKTSTSHVYVIEQYAIVMVPLWLLGASRMVLRFAVFKRAAGSFGLGRNAQLIAGHMAYLQQSDRFEAAEVPSVPWVPCLIVTGERDRDVEESPIGHRVKDEHSSQLVTLDRVWSASDDLLTPDLKDLCLSFALFKCLRRRFAGHPLAEAGSSWALRFVHDGMLGGKDDHERMFRVIAGELAFASDFYYSALPVASLGTMFAAVHFFLSLVVSGLIIRLTQILLHRAIKPLPILKSLIAIIAVVNVSAEVWEMVSGVQSNWTKISMISHYIRCRRHGCFQRILSCLLRSKSPKLIWKDEIRQEELLKPSLLGDKQSRLGIFKHSFLLSKTCHYKPVIKVPPIVKAKILCSFRSNGGQLSDGMATVRRRCSISQDDDITWACHGGTTTDVLLVWHIATSLFDIRSSSQRASSSSFSTPTDSMVVAQSLSRYCTYLVAEAPDLLPGDSAWAKRRYEEVKKGIEEAASKSSDDGVMPESGAYARMIDLFSAERSHEVLNRGSRLGKQLEEEAERQRSGEEEEADDAGAGGQDAVWELLAEFWSEMVLYLAPSDNVKCHKEALQRGGELITLLWALLLHAGITSRPARHVPEP